MNNLKNVAEIRTVIFDRYTVISRLFPLYQWRLVVTVGFPVQLLVLKDEQRS